MSFFGIHVLVPSILRKSRGRNQGYVAEVPLVRHFKAMNCDVVESTATDFDVLVTMQHYLAPTRLLDWTENLLVALHFAVRDPDQDKEDGALWIFNAGDSIIGHRLVSGRARYFSKPNWTSSPGAVYLGSGVALSGTTIWKIASENIQLTREPADAKRSQGDQGCQLAGDQVYDPRDTSVDVRKLKFVKNGQPFVKDLNAKNSWAEPELLDVRLRAPVAVYPNRSNRRIRAQSGCFTLHGGRFDSKPRLFDAAQPCPEYVGLPITLHQMTEG